MRILIQRGQGIFLAAIIWAVLALPTPVFAAGKRLNVLFIAVDDLRPQLNCYGFKQMITPNIDRLAQGGVLFSRAYCQQAVCSPSRTSIMCGLRPDSTRIYDLHTHFRTTVPDVVTLSQHFIANGYHAVNHGKIYHGGRRMNDKLSWSEPYVWSKGGRGYNLKENVESIQARRKAARAKGLRGRALRKASMGPATEAADAPDSAYTDYGIATAGVESLRRLNKMDKPFFLAVGFVKPHLAFSCPKRYWDKYDPAKINLADNPFTPKGAPQMAMHNSGELRSYQDMPKGRKPVADEQARRLIHGYYACVSFIDAQIGRLTAELDKLGIRDNTIIILWGDHGWQLGDHGMWCKHSNFETSAWVPLIVSAPGIKGGKRSKALVEYVDMYPSLCELAGLPLPKHLEGESFVPLMKNPNLPWKKAAFSLYPRGKHMGRSMRTDRYRYTEWAIRGQKPVGVELYDHEKDPKENVNLAALPEHKELVANLSAMLKRDWRGVRDDLRR